MEAVRKPIDVVDTTPFDGPVKSPAYHPRAPLDRDTEYYNFDHPKRGVAIILNHEQFQDQNYGTRHGSRQDAVRLEAELKELGFEVRAYTDLKSEEVHGVVISTSEMDHTLNDCVVFVVLSHGHMGTFSTNDGIYLLDNVFDAFTADKCKSLAGKPKIFIVQACRTNQEESEDRGVDKGIRFGDGKIMASSRALKDFTDSHKENVQINYSLPRHSDFLIYYSTQPGYFSFRSVGGSHFIQALCQELSVNGTILPLHEILTNVSRAVATKFTANSDNELYHGAKQMPLIHTTLIRNFKFNVKSPTGEPTMTDIGNIPVENDTRIQTIPMKNNEKHESEDDEENCSCDRFKDRFCCLT